MRTFAGILLALFSVSAPVAAQTVVLDPGHGGGDPGAVGCGLQEADVVLDVSLRAATLLRNAGITVHLTRSDDRFIELSARSSFANSRGADRFVSIHANANAGTPATGTETFVYTSASSTSRSMGQTLQNDLIATWGLRDRGLKTANFSVIRRTSMPGALAELAFINRCDPDARLLGSSAERGRIAAALARSVLASFGRTGPTDPAPPVDPPVDPPVEPPGSGTGRIIGVAFEDIGVGLEDTSRRIAGATVRVNGETLASAADGLFQVNFAPGTYRIEVSKTGYESAARDCVVRAGSDAWCSVGLALARMSPSVTRVRGVIYEENGTGIGTAPRLAGAIVDFGGMRVTTGADGSFSFEVSPGNLTLNVSKEGYSPAIRSCTANGAETWCSVGLTSAARAGSMQGVIYVDGQLSNRIEGATVTIREIGSNVSTANRSGYWRFEVPAGTYTLDIDAVGYDSTSEICTVREGAETWCSVGLVNNGGGSFVIDDRQPEEAALDHNPQAIAGGCSASGTGASNLWLLGLFGLMFFRRRRHGALAAVLAVGAGLTGCSETPDVAASSQAPLTTALSTDDALQLATEVPSFARVEDVTTVAQGDFVDLELSPDGEHLALSHARYGALSLVSLQTRELRVLHEGPQAGYEPRWRDDSQVLGVRTAGQTSTAATMLAFELSGKVATAFQPARVLTVRVDQDEIVMRTADGDETRLGPPGDRYFEPRASADGEYVAFRGLSTGLYVHRRADGATFMVGTGSHARFDAEGEYMVFERSVEDGHERTASSLYVMDLKSAELRYGLIETNVVRPDAPSIGNGRFAFMDEGSALVGELRFER